MRWILIPLLLVLAMLISICPVAAEYDPCDPAQRGPEAVKIAQLRECPASTTWGYEYPYTMAYGTGTPYYVGHNYGLPSGAIYENPANYPYGIPEPAVIYGDPEYAMFLNYGYSFPFHGPTNLVVTGPLYGCLNSPFAFMGDPSLC
ncbi:hypothetical protein LRC198 [Methanocella arvoryzae MRE50]|uniref:Uncharacterized protein n=2 Tax=Methanocella TaxID=570266 RepID=Q0W8U4_METAR|nr:hypothetical protein LRC198 [Methanocella arvoryzae MRE50]